MEALVTEIVGSVARDRRPDAPDEPAPWQRYERPPDLPYGSGLIELTATPHPSLAVGPFASGGGKSPEAQSLVKDLSQCRIAEGKKEYAQYASAFAKLTVSSTGEVTAVQIDYYASSEESALPCWKHRLARIQFPPSKQPTRTLDIFWFTW